MDTELILAVRIDDTDAAGHIHRFDAYGLPYGVALIDRVRNVCPNIAASDIGIFEWALARNGEVSIPSYDICFSEGWSLPLSEEQARKSERFSNKFIVVTRLPKNAFAKAVSMKISKEGHITPTVDIDIVFRLWEEGGFLELADMMEEETIKKDEGLIKRLLGRWW